MLDDLVQRLRLPRRARALRQRLEVGRKPRRVAVPDRADSGHGADPETHVVASEPVGEVVPRPEVPPAAALGPPAEVRRLVPAIAGPGQRLDDVLEIPLQRLALAGELIPEGMCEPCPGLGLELVAGQVLGLEGEGLAQVTSKVGGALAGDAVDQVERDVVKLGITQSVHGAPDVVRGRAALEHGQQVQAEALCAHGHAVDPAVREPPGQVRREGFRVRFDRHLRRRRQRVQEARERVRFGERRRPTSQVDGLERVREDVALQIELSQKRIDVRVVRSAAADDGHEVAVTAAMRAEREVHVEVPHPAHDTGFRRGRRTSSPPQFGQTLSIASAHAGQNVHSNEQMRSFPVDSQGGAAALARRLHLDGHQRFVPSPRLSTARKASCGTSTPPTCFMRFLPFFCRSSSLRLRVMSPP